MVIFGIALIRAVINTFITYFFSHLSKVWHNVQLMHIFPHQSVTEHAPAGTAPPNITIDATRPYADRFYLVVLDQDQEGVSVVHMWYIHLEAKVLEGKNYRGELITLQTNPSCR